jgi:superfamily II DNA/RNA helicase
MRCLNSLASAKQSSSARYVIPHTCWCRPFLVLYLCLQTKEHTKAVGAHLRAEGHAVSVITGDQNVSNADRQKVLQDFATGISKLLIATDVMARGIDIQNLQLVVNLDLPYIHRSDDPDFVNFQQRCGRVGRFGAVGACIHLITGPKDAHFVDQVITHFGLHDLFKGLDSDLDAAVTQVDQALMIPDATPAPAAPAPAPSGGAGIVSDTTKWADVA